MNGTLRPESAEQNARLARCSAFDDSIAAERGRLFVARALIENPEQRVRCEEQFGKEYCVLRWPEVYNLEASHNVLSFIPRLNYEEPADKPEFDDSGLLITKL